MIVTLERVDSFNLRNLLGYDATEEEIAKHAACITDSSMIWLAKADGVEACAIGVIPLHTFSNKAYLWLIHTRICEQHPVRFIRWSRKVIHDVMSYYPVLVGLCRCDNPYSQAWLEWLGAVFDRGSEVNGCHKFRIE